MDDTIRKIEKNVCKIEKALGIVVWDRRREAKFEKWVSKNRNLIKKLFDNPDRTESLRVELS